MTTEAQQQWTITQALEEMISRFEYEGAKYVRGSYVIFKAKEALAIEKRNKMTYEPSDGQDYRDQE